MDLYNVKNGLAECSNSWKDYRSWQVFDDDGFEDYLPLSTDGNPSYKQRFAFMDDGNTVLR